MLELYLFCLIVGGGLLGFSLLTGGEHGDTEAHSELDFHADADVHSLEINTESSVTELDIHSDESISNIQHTELTNQNSLDSVKLISFRNIIYFMAFFGLTGSIFSYLAFLPLITFFASTSMGIFSGWFGYKLMKYLKSSESGESLNLYDLKGKQAIVTININKNSKGKIQTQCKGQTIELIAMIDDSSDKEFFKTRDKVLITDIKNNIAFIIEIDF